MNIWSLLSGASNAGAAGARGALGVSQALKTAADSGGFWDKLSNWLGGSDQNGTPNWLTAAGAGGALYGGYQQQKMAKKQYDLQKDAYNFNKMLSQRQIDKENEAQRNLNLGWANSTYGSAV